MSRITADNARARMLAACLYANAPRRPPARRPELRLAGVGPLFPGGGVPIAGSRLKGSCDRAALATLPGARLLPGQRLPRRAVGASKTVLPRPPPSRTRFLSLP